MRARAQTALARGDRRAAIEAIEALERAQRDAPEARLEQSELWIRAGEAPRSVWRLEQAVARFGDRSDLRLALANAALLVGDAARAAAIAREIPESAAEHPQALLVRARAEIAENGERALLRPLLAALAVARGDEARGEALLRDAVRADTSGARVALVRFLSARGRSADAIALLEEGLAQRPTTPTFASRWPSCGSMRATTTRLPTPWRASRGFVRMRRSPHCSARASRSRAPMRPERARSSSASRRSSTRRRHSTGSGGRSSRPATPLAPRTACSSPRRAIRPRRARGSS